MNNAACTSRKIQSAQRVQHKQEFTDEMILKEFENEIYIANVTLCVTERVTYLYNLEEERVLDIVR